MEVETIPQTEFQEGVEVFSWGIIRRKLMTAEEFAQLTAQPVGE